MVQGPKYKVQGIPGRRYKEYKVLSTTYNCICVQTYIRTYVHTVHTIHTVHTVHTAQTVHTVHTTKTVHTARTYPPYRAWIRTYVHIYTCQKGISKHYTIGNQ